MTTDHDPRTLPPERAMLYIPDCQGEPDAPGLTPDELLLLEHRLVIHLDIDPLPSDGLVWLGVYAPWRAT